MKGKFDDEGYQIEIYGKNVLVTEPMKKYAWDKLSKIERFHNHIMYVHMTLDIQKLEHVATAVVKFDHMKVKTEAASTDMYVSIDRAIDRLQSLLRRYKSRIQDHHKKSMKVVDMQVNVLERDMLEEANEEIEAANRERERAKLKKPKVIGNETKPLKTLTTDEAMMKLDLSGDQFLVFCSEEDKKLRVLYRRTDGNYGLILPE